MACEVGVATVVAVDVAVTVVVWMIVRGGA